MDHLITDVLVVGAGAAGMYASVSAAKSGMGVRATVKFALRLWKRR